MRYLLLLIAVVVMASCTASVPGNSDDASLLDKYTTVRLTADVSHLPESEREMIPLLIEAADIMDSLFWHQAYGDPDSLWMVIDDESIRRFAEINYGPWDRLDDNAPFVEGVGAKPRGANYYPADMTEEEFETAAAGAPELRSEYTMVRRDEARNLVAIPYHEYFADQTERAARLLEDASALAGEEGLRNYLALRAEALRTDEYRESDMAWLDMKDNRVEIIIGPIEHYEDQLFGRKAAHESFVHRLPAEELIKLALCTAADPPCHGRLPAATAAH